MMHPAFKALTHAGGHIYEVGGTVRDRLLGQEAKDKDYLITGLPLETMASLLKPYGKVALVGKSFGVIKFEPFRGHGEILDMAIPRTEISTGVGHRDFAVTYDHRLPVEADLKRRDFTINAMAFDPEAGRLIDPYGGETDLKARRLKQVFADAFVEDPLRLLRAVQFAARFSLEIEDETWEAMKSHAARLGNVSMERIIEEIRKLFLAERPSRGIDLLLRSGLLKFVFPEVEAIIGIEQDKQAGDDVYSHTMRVLDAAAGDPIIDHRGDLELLLAALYHDVGKKQTRKYSAEHKRYVFFGHQIVSRKLAVKRLNALKCSTIGADVRHVAALIDNHMFETKAFYSEKAIRRFVNKVGPDLIYKLIDLRIADNRGGKYPHGVGGILKLKKRITAELAKKPPFGPKDLAINGHDIMQLGIPEGPPIGTVIAELMELVLDDPNLNTRDVLLQYVQRKIALTKESRDDSPSKTGT